MDRDTLNTFLKRTLDDGRLSRSEARCLRELLSDGDITHDDLVWLQGRAFDLAQARTDEARAAAGAARRLLRWAESVTRIILQTQANASKFDPEEDAWFFPGPDDGPERLVDLIERTRRTLDICVFTITDNRISRAILDAHKRGVTVRIMTDQDKAYDRGSDVFRLDDSGIDVRRDTTDCHMHHKFAICDRKLLINGSFNWTRSASEANHENLTTTTSPALIDAFQDEFERLWITYA